MAVKVKRDMLIKPFKGAVAVGIVGFGVSAIGFKMSFEAGMVGATISVSGLTASAITAKVYEELFDEEIYGNLFEFDNIVEVEE